MENFQNESKTDFLYSDADCSRSSVEPINPQNPFKNPTENPEYNGDYGAIVPQIAIEGCEIPHLPGKAEKKKIRYFYNIAGGGILFHLITSVILANILTFAAMAVLMVINGISLSDMISGEGVKISEYINGSSIASGITLLSYLTANLITFFIGCKFADIEVKSLFKTEKLTGTLVIQYIFAGLFIQRIAGITVALLENLMTQGDLMANSDIVKYSDPKALIISACYACIVAPVTEELLYRGFIMKTFSKVSQRFGIFASAFFFGIMHGNVAQFVLAFLVGVFMGYLDVKHNSLIPSICVHFAVNLMSSVSGLLLNYIENNSAEYLIFSLLMFIIIFIGLVMFITFCRKNKLPKSNIHQQFRCLNIALTSPVVVIAAAVYFVILLITTFL